MRSSWLKVGIIFASVIIWTTAAATTGVPDPNLCTATSPGGAMYTCPTGDGETLASAGASILVTIVDSQAVPIAGLPAADIWVESAVAGDLTFCGSSNIADGPTDANGQTTISGNLAGGGFTQGGLVVYVQGLLITGSPAMAIDVNSIDINGDLAVDLCDIALFAEDIGSTNFRSDLNHDGFVNLFDISIFSLHQCHTCIPEPDYPFNGEIGIFFDAAGTQTGITGIDVGVPFNVYVVAFDATGGIAGYQFGITVDSNIQLGDAVVYPAGATNHAAGGSDVRVTTGGNCLPEVGAVLLVEYQAVLTDVVNNGSVCLMPASSACPSEPDGPAYLDCVNDCGWRAFNTAYEGCAVVNGTGPVADTHTSWGAVKALYNR